MAAWDWPSSHVHNVVDGDTIDSTLTKVVDVGFSITSMISLPARLRLARINTARSNSARGKQAKARVAECTRGNVVHIRTIKTYKYGGPDDKVGEYVAEVTLPGGENLSDLLVREGLAVYWDGEGPRPADS